MKRAIYVRLANYICKFSLCKLYATLIPKNPSIPHPLYIRTRPLPRFLFIYMFLLYVA